jgi:hypothetical protein
MDKQQWIDDTLKSIEGIKRASPEPFLFPKILNRLKSASQPVRVAKSKLALAFSALLILIGLNIAAVLTKDGAPSSQSSDRQTNTELIPTQSNPYLEILIN